VYHWARVRRCAPIRNYISVPRLARIPLASTRARPLLDARLDSKAINANNVATAKIKASLLPSAGCETSDSSGAPVRVNGTKLGELN